MSSIISAQVFGTLGAVCWSIQLLPQIWMNYRRGHTHGLQPTMMLLWSAAGIPLGVYNIIRSFPIALQIQPEILTLLSLITWCQTQYYPPARDTQPRSKTWCSLICAVACVLCGSIQCALVFGIRTAIQGHNPEQIENHPATMTMGVLAALLLSAGVCSHYIDIWREETVRGISFLFVALDALGDLTSLISVTLWWKAGASLDILGLVVYGSEFVLWSGIMLCGLKYNLWPKISKHIATRHDVDNYEMAGDTIGHSNVHREATGSAFRTASRDGSLSIDRSSAHTANAEIRRRQGNLA